MEIEIKVEAEDLMNGNITNTAFVTAVALGPDGKTREVSPLLLETEEEKKRFAEGEKRMNDRLKERNTK